MQPIIIIMSLLSFMISNNSQQLPVLSLSVGPLLSTILILLIGFLQYYSCYLYIEHLGNHQDMDDAIKYHFWDSNIAKAIYNFINFIFFTFYVGFYYNQVVSIWDTLFPNQNSILNPIFNAIGIVLLVFVLRYFKIATKVLAFGVIFIFISCFFFIWVLASAPSGNKKPPLIGSGIGQFIVWVGIYFQVQQVLIPLLRYLPKKKAKHIKKYTMITFIIGSSLFIYFCFVGCYGLINRQVYNPPASEINSYFPLNIWEINFFQVSLLLLFYSSLGEFLSLANKRFFALLGSFCTMKKLKDDKPYTIPEMIFISCMIGVYMTFRLCNYNPYNVGLIMVGTYIYVFVIPAALQFKCLYFARPKAIFNIVYKGSSSKNSILKFDERQSTQPKQLTAQNKENQSDIVKEDNLKQKQLLQNQSGIQDRTQKINYSRNVSKLQQVYQMKQLTNTDQSGFNQSRLQSISNTEKSPIKIQTINEVCPAKLPVGMWKVFDLCSIFLMLALGTFITVQTL